MLATLTSLGLSAAAGLNAYIPFLIVAFAAKFTNVITLPSQYSWIESWWAIGIACVLLLTEVFLDKIPAVDSLNDAVGTVIRPATAGLIVAATTAAQNFENNSSWMAEHSWIGVVLAVVVALIVHSGKAVSRPMLNAGTAGVAAPVASTAEDGLSFTLSLTALFIPILAIALLLALCVALVWLVTKAIRRRKNRSVASA